MKKIEWRKKIANNGFELAKKMPSIKTLSLVLLFLFLAFLNVSQSLTIVQLQYKDADSNEKMVDFQNQNKVLTEKLEKVDTNQYIEEKAKNNLGMVKSGDTPIKVYEKAEKTVQAPQEIQTSDKVSIYMKDWYEKLEEWISK